MAADTATRHARNRALAAAAQVGYTPFVGDQSLLLSLTWEGASLKRLTWRDLLELVKAIHEGAKLLDPEVDVSRLLPVRLEEGSVRGVFRIPEVAAPAVTRLFEGPTKDWTPRDFHAAEPLQAFMRKRNATIAYRIGRARQRELQVIDPLQAPPSTRATSRFFVFVAGLGGAGDVPNVSLRIGGTRKQRAIIHDPALLKRLGQMFWENAYVTLEYSLDPVTGDMFDAVVVGVDKYQHRPLIEHFERGGTIDLATNYATTAELIAERHQGDD